MNAKRTSRWPWAFASLLALAQSLSAAPYTPYDPPKIEASVNIVSWIYVLVGLMAICAVAFKNSRRTHLD